MVTTDALIEANIICNYSQKRVSNKDIDGAISDLNHAITELDKFFEALLQHRNGKKHWDIINFYLATGCRRNEALNLQWEDVDFERGLITFWIGAKHKKYRSVLMYDLLREMLIRRYERKLVRPFTDEISASGLSHTFKAVRIKACIKNAKLHDLRKTYATLLANHKINKIFIQGALGHAPGSEVTADDYIGSIDDKTQAELNSSINDLASRFNAIREKVQKKNISENSSESTEGTAEGTTKQQKKKAG